MIRWLFSGQLARSGNGKDSGAGYTIVEVLVVLTVTSTMFAAIVIAFSNRQHAAEFNLSVRNFESKLQTVISEISNGSYQGGFQCTISGSGDPVVTVGVVEPGSNKGCIFLGKVMGGYVENPQIYTVLGRRTDGTAANLDVTNFADAHPTAIVGGGGGPDLTEKFSLGYGLTVRRIYSIAANGDNDIAMSSIGFMHELVGGISATDALSGDRTVRLYGIAGGSPIAEVTPTATTASAITAANLTRLPYGARLCLLGGTDPVGDKRAEITIGANNSQTTIEVLINTGLGGKCGNV